MKNKKQIQLTESFVYLIDVPEDRDKNEFLEEIEKLYEQDDEMFNIENNAFSFHKTKII